MRSKTVCRADVDGVCLVRHIERASSLKQRMLGLLGRASLPPGSALLISPCRAVHTWFMRFPIDVIFLDGESRITRVVCAVPPFRMLWGPMRTRSVLEVQTGWLDCGTIGHGVRMDVLPGNG